MTDATSAGAAEVIARIELHGCIVRIVPAEGVKLDVPRRQSFAWSKDAQAYAKQLSAARGWAIQVKHG